MRRSFLARSDHARSSVVFPLPGGAETTVTFFRVTRSSAAKRSSRRSRRAAPETPVEAGRERGAGRGAVAILVILPSPLLVACPKHAARSNNLCLDEALQLARDRPRECPAFRRPARDRRRLPWTCSRRRLPRWSNRQGSSTWHDP